VFYLCLGDFLQLAGIWGALKKSKAMSMRIFKECPAIVYRLYSAPDPMAAPILTGGRQYCAF
jgi:hypothetical protein